MKGFFDGIFKDDSSKKKKDGNSNNNPFANVKLPGQPRKFTGQGQSLGGTLPGKVIAVSFTQPGPLGVRVEKGPSSKTAIVAGIVDGSQAERAGLQRGDILCYAGTDGKEEIAYNEFLALAKSSERPLYFEVRRVPKTKALKEAGADNTISSSNKKNKSAEAFARKQAVIAAAEAREKAAKAKSKPVKKIITKESNATNNATGTADVNEHLDDTPKTEAARHAAAAAKQQEANLAAQLGYNPYETNKATAGQARNATVAANVGPVQADQDRANSRPQQVPSTTTEPAALPKTTQPTDPAATTVNNTFVEPSVEFERAFETVVTQNDAQSVKSSFGIMRKLIVNATTKGHGDSEQAAKFRKVRLTNPKIKAAVVDVEGALDLMMSTGFQLTVEEGSEDSFLVYPPGDAGPGWLSTALQRMQTYEAAS